MGLTIQHLHQLGRELAPGAAIEIGELNPSHGVLSRYQPSTRDAIVGHRRLTAELPSGQRIAMVVKSKAAGAVVRRRLEAVYRRFSPRLAELQHGLAPSILDDSHLRELAIYRLDRSALRAIMPMIARVWQDDAEAIYAIAMEELLDVRHRATIDDLDVWLPADVAVVTRDLARVHREFVGQLSPNAPPPWLVPFGELHNHAMARYQAALLDYNAETFPELFDRAFTAELARLLADAPARHRYITSRPLTLIHGDLSPRNVCLKRDGDGYRLCAYDWELAQVHLPQRDVVEFLCYVVRPDRGWHDDATRRLLRDYRDQLGDRTTPADDDTFDTDFAAALAEFATFKLLVQGITHQLLGCRDYFERLVDNTRSALATWRYS